VVVVVMEDWVVMKEAGGGGGGNGGLGANEGGWWYGDYSRSAINTQEGSGRWTDWHYADVQASRMLIKVN